MPTWFTWSRAILLVFAALGLLTGLGLIAQGGADAPQGIWVVALGGGLLIVVVLERTRYRSESAEARGDDPGPGGGERDPRQIEPRFRPTDEVFRDPTSGRLMRVYVDPRTGERRYLAEA